MSGRVIALSDMTLEGMTAWGAVNAIMRWHGLPDASFGEWCDVVGIRNLDPVDAAQRILRHRGKADTVTVFCLSGLEGRGVDGEAFFVTEEKAVESGKKLTAAGHSELDLYRIELPRGAVSAETSVLLLNHNHTGWRSHYLGKIERGEFELAEGSK